MKYFSTIQNPSHCLIQSYISPETQEKCLHSLSVNAVSPVHTSLPLFQHQWQNQERKLTSERKECHYIVTLSYNYQSTILQTLSLALFLSLSLSLSLFLPLQFSLYPILQQCRAQAHSHFDVFYSLSYFQPLCLSMMEMEEGRMLSDSVWEFILKESYFNFVSLFSVRYDMQGFYT